MGEKENGCGSCVCPSEQGENWWQTNQALDGAAAAALSGNFGKTIDVEYQ